MVSVFSLTAKHRPRRSGEVRVSLQVKAKKKKWNFLKINAEMCECQAVNKEQELAVQVFIDLRD